MAEGIVGINILFGDHLSASSSATSFPAMSLAPGTMHRVSCSSLSRNLAVYWLCCGQNFSLKDTATIKQLFSFLTCLYWIQALTKGLLSSDHSVHSGIKITLQLANDSTFEYNLLVQRNISSGSAFSIPNYTNFRIFKSKCILSGSTLTIDLIVEV